MASAVLERQFESHLSDVWWRCFQHVSERRTINVSIHRTVRIELRMVERVKGFETEFERLAFREFGCLVHSEVEIVDARTVKEAPLGVSLRP